MQYIYTCECAILIFFFPTKSEKSEIFFSEKKKKGKTKFLRVYSRKHNGILWNGKTAALVGRNGWPPDVRSVHVAAIISYRCVQLVGTQRNPANLYLALVSHEYSGRNHSVLHELLHYYRDFPITNYAKFGCRITTKQRATTSMGSIIDIGKCLVCETSLLLFKLQYRIFQTLHRLNKFQNCNLLQIFPQNPNLLSNLTSFKISLKNVPQILRILFKNSNQLWYFIICKLVTSPLCKS